MMVLYRKALYKQDGGWFLKHTTFGMKDCTTKKWYGEFDSNS
jgi:hypothetical protein